jgi:trimeric autotransporter adhesin
MNPLIQSKNASPLILIALLLGCLALSPRARAVVPAPDGGYPGQNTAEGQSALLHLAGGTYNTALGWASLGFNVTGNYNTGVGAATLLNNTADQNTATGAGALLSNTIGFNNTANGAFALFSNITGGFNTGTGVQALYHNTTGDSNMANGEGALYSNTTGTGNTAVGVGALNNSIGGDNNTGLGLGAGQSIHGSGNVCIGHGVHGEVGVDDTTYIRNVNTLTQSFSAGVNDYVTVRLTDGRLGHTSVVSSQRYKEDIKPLATSSQALYALNPVSFRLKKEFDPTQALGFGLIAEEVEKVDPDLVYRNAKGQVESVRYEMVNAMLLNEFLREHRAFAEEQQKVRKLEATVADLIATVKEQAAQIQKVSAQLELNNSASQTLVENP